MVWQIGLQFAADQLAETALILYPLYQSSWPEGFHYYNIPVVGNPSHTVEALPTGLVKLSCFDIRLLLRFAIHVC